MRKLLVLIPFLIHSCCGGVYAQSFIQKQEISAYNLLENAGFENGVAKHTVAVECGLGTKPYGYGTRSLSCTGVASAKTLAEQTVTISNHTPYIGATFKVSAHVIANTSIVQVCALFDGNEQGCLNVAASASVNAEGYREYAIPVQIPWDQSSSFTVGYRIKTTSTTTTAIAADATYVGPFKGFVGVMPPTTNTTAYTPTITGAGTPTNVDFVWWQDGDKVGIQGRFTSGTSTGVTLSVSLPNGYTYKGVGGLGKMVGTAARSAGASTYVKDHRVLMNGNNMVFSIIEATGGTDPASPQLGNAIFGGSGQTFYVNALVPVNELSANSTVSLVGLVPSETIFSAKVDSSGNVTGQNVTFLQTPCSISDTSRFTCQYVSGFWGGNTPNCDANPSADSSGVSISAAVDQPNSNTTQLQVRTLSGGSKSAQQWSVKCQRQGADYTRAMNSPTNIPYNMSGTYTPTLTNQTNVAASTAIVSSFIRIGAIVTVTGSVTIDPTSTGATAIRMTLPVARANFASANDAWGIGSSDTYTQGGKFAAVSGAQVVEYTFAAANAASVTHGFHFSYLMY